jgi:hypothetical protein
MQYMCRLFDIPSAFHTILGNLSRYFAREDLRSKVKGHFLDFCIKEGFSSVRMTVGLFKPHWLGLVRIGGPLLHCCGYPTFTEAR